MGPHVGAKGRVDVCGRKHLLGREGEEVWAQDVGKDSFFFSFPISYFRIPIIFKFKQKILVCTKNIPT
jgi:hypothetical protein